MLDDSVESLGRDRLVSLPAGSAIGFIPAILEELLDAQANKPECFPARILARVEERKNQ